MKHEEFKKIVKDEETRYVLESATAGATSAGAVATAPKGIGELRRRLQELKLKAESLSPEVDNEPDHEISMASNELQSIAKDATNLLDLVRQKSEEEGLMAWQQSKITKAADYMNSVLQSISGDEDLSEISDFKKREIEKELQHEKPSYNPRFNRGSRPSLPSKFVIIKGPEEVSDAQFFGLQPTKNPKVWRWNGSMQPHWIAPFNDDPGKRVDPKEKFDSGAWKVWTPKNEGVAEGDELGHVAALYIDEFADGDHWYVKGTQEVIQRFVQLANSLEDEAVKGTEYEPGVGKMAKIHKDLGDDSVPQWKIVPAKNLEQLKPIDNLTLRKLSRADLSDGVEEFISDFLWSLEERGQAVVNPDSSPSVAETSPMIKPPTNRFDNKKEAFASVKEQGVAEGSEDKTAQQRKTERDKQRTAPAQKDRNAAQRKGLTQDKDGTYYAKEGVAEGMEESAIQDVIVDTVERLFRKNNLSDYGALEAVRQGVKHHFSKPGATAESAIEGILNIVDKRMRKSGDYLDLSRFKEALRQGVAHQLKKQGVAEGSEQDDPYRGTTPPQGKKAARNAHRLGKTYTNPHSSKYHKKDHEAWERDYNSEMARLKNKGVAETSPMIKPPTNRFDNKKEAFAYAKEHGGKVFQRTYIDPNTGNKQISFVVKKEQGVAEGLPGGLSKSDYTSGATKKSASISCTACHGRKFMYKVDGKLFADNKLGATKVKCPTCHGTGDKQGVAESPYLGKGNHRPGWMLRADPELAKKFKEKEQQQRAKEKAYGDPSAGISVDNDGEQSFDIDRILSNIEKDVYRKAKKDDWHLIQVALLDKALNLVGRDKRKTYEPYVQMINNWDDAKEFLDTVSRDAQKQGIEEDDSLDTSTKRELVRTFKNKWSGGSVEKAIQNTIDTLYSAQFLDRSQFEDAEDYLLYVADMEQMPEEPYHDHEEDRMGLGLSHDSFDRIKEDKIKGVDGKACWKGKRYAGKVKKPDGTYKDKCVPVGEDAYTESLFAELNQVVSEKAPPGDKYERMVKHIKKGYAKDGKLSAKEKSIAYATAWKAKNKAKK